MGANTRLIIYTKFEKRKLNKNLSILIINTFSSLLLGFFLSILTQISSLNFSSQLVLLFSTGFLGSLSTFSTFIIEVFESFINNSWLEGVEIISLSVLGTFSIGLIVFLLIDFV